MKILILTDSYFPFVGEYSDFSCKLANFLLSSGHKVAVICPSIDHQNTSHEYKGIQIYRVGTFNFTQRTFPRQTIEKAMSIVDPDIIHLQNHFHLAQYALDYAKKFIIPTVGTITEKLFQNVSWDKYIGKFKGLDFVTAGTEDEANVFMEAGFAKKILVMPKIENYEQLYKQVVH